MRAILKALVLVLLFARSLPAQLPQTPIQATVTDPNGTPYAFGTGSASIVCPGNEQPTYNGSPLTRTITVTGFDGFGKFSMQLWNLAVIQPVGCAWTFAITAQDGKTSFTTGQITTVTGNTLVDLSAAISAYAVPLPVGSLSQFLGMATPGLRRRPSQSRSPQQ